MEKKKEKSTAGEKIIDAAIKRLRSGQWPTDNNIMNSISEMTEVDVAKAMYDLYDIDEVLIAMAGAGANQIGLDEE